MFYFLLAGAKDVIKQKTGEASEVSLCPSCGAARRFCPATRRQYLTLFFIPILPIGSEKPCLVCQSCGVCIQDSSRGEYYCEPGEERVFCPQCGTAFMVPEASMNERICCPRCRRSFQIL